jgi:type II secretion system protein H
MTRRGFSLVEIVVVLAILGIAAAAVLPALRATTRAEGVAAAAADMARLLRAGRAAALARAVPVTVTFVPTSRRYLVEAERDDTAATLAEGTLPVRTDLTVAATDRPMRVTFDPYGVAKPDSLTWTGPDGLAVVGVAPWSGDVYVRVVGR